MITYVQGNLFESPAEVLVNTVNTVGVMGKGIARSFKQYFPEMFREYQAACERGELTVGSLLLWRSANKSVLNFPTKRHWKQRSRLDDIERGLITFADSYDKLAIVSIAFPQLGCGNGELDWESQVRPLMERHLGNLPIRVYVYLCPPDGPAEHRDRLGMKQWLRAEPASLGFVEVWNDLENLVSGECGSVSGSGTARNAKESSDDRFLAVKSETGVTRLYFDDLASLWMRLRSFGFLSVSDVPDAYMPVGDAIIDLIAQLPYVQPVRFSVSGRSSPDDIFEWSEGVMLKLPANDDREFGERQLEIFSYA